MVTEERTALAGLDLVQNDEATSIEFAACQWKLIDALESEYLGKLVHNTRCHYEDENWFDLNGAQGSRTGIYWSVLSDAPALKVLLKSMMWDQIFDRSLELSTAKIRYSLVQKTIQRVITNKRLLNGQPGEVLLGLSHITDDDLLMLIDEQIFSLESESKVILACNGLNIIVGYIIQYGERVPVYQMRAQLPWLKSGETVTAWVKRRLSDLKFMFTPTVGFEPLLGDTANSLVEASLTLIDDHFDHFSEIGPFLAEYTTLQDRTDDYVRSLEPKFVFGLLEKYAPIFGHIVPAPDLSKKHSFVSKGRAVFLWLRSLVRLCRAACINIILLTSGLRNFDVRYLKVGACKPSGRVGILFYLRSDIQKTGNVVFLPVPPQTNKAIQLLDRLKDTKSSYLIDWGGATKKSVPEYEDVDEVESKDDTNLKSSAQFNNALRAFAEHFHIPFVDSKGDIYTAHNYRTTVAGWLGSASNLSLLLVRRLFGHSNNMMPTVYLNNNPAFVAEREAQKAQANAATARQLALAASQGLLAGVKGEQLERGYQLHKSLMEADSRKSHSLTDSEIMLSFSGVLEQRIRSGSMCGFLTPFGVVCGRNPRDSSQPPCAKRAHRDKTSDIPIEILKHVSDIDPQQCIGTSCSEALLGPWSTAILDTVIWYRALLRHQLGDAFDENHFIESAKQFIRQYENPIKKVFGIEALNDAEVENGGRKANSQAAP
nr:hypothetical protein [uncultured Deefgea sp.]